MFDDPTSSRKEWRSVELMEVISKEKDSLKRGPFGGAIKKEIFVPSGYKIYEQKNAIRNDFSLGTYFINSTKFKEMEGFSIIPGDLIISCSGTIGKVAIVPASARPGIINQALLKIRLNKTKVMPIFFKHLLETDQLQRRLFSDAAGSAIKNVKPLSHIRKAIISLPPLPLQDQFAQRVSEIHKLEAVQSASHCRLDALFQSLLHHAFNGDL
jgi:type I restriction enzyme S subunit